MEKFWHWFLSRVVMKIYQYIKNSAILIKKITFRS